MAAMPHSTATERLATRLEVVAHREALRRLADAHGLSTPRVSPTGTVIVHNDAPGYRAVRRFATAASDVVGAWVNVVTDDVTAAEVDTATL
jgi:hypothetical protein